MHLIYHHQDIFLLYNHHHHYHHDIDIKHALTIYTTITTCNSNTEIHMYHRACATTMCLISSTNTTYYNRLYLISSTNTTNININNNLLHHYDIHQYHQYQYLITSCMCML